jgi:LysM repeat protein
LGKPFLNRRVLAFLLLDLAVLGGFMAVFTAVNHAFVPEPAVQPVNSSLSQGLRSIPSTITVEASGTGDYDLQKLRSKSVKVYTHRVRMGENYWTIAKDNHIDIDTLIGANPNMPFTAQFNQALNILSRKGILCEVGKGDTLEGLAREYGVDEKTLEKENGISWLHGLKQGDLLFLPGAKPRLMTPPWHDYFTRRGIFGDPLGHWEAVTSPFGPRQDPITGEPGFHDGVDLHAAYGSPVYAAAAGKVLFTGVAGGYGNLIEIKHPHHYLTYYAHLSKILVKRGQRVRRGSLIGKVGATGRVTGPHLHFEIHHDGKIIDPLLFI